MRTDAGGGWLSQNFWWLMLTSMRLRVIVSWELIKEDTANKNLVSLLAWPHWRIEWTSSNDHPPVNSWTFCMDGCLLVLDFRKISPWIGKENQYLQAYFVPLLSGGTQSQWVVCTAWWRKMSMRRVVLLPQPPTPYVEISASNFKWPSTSKFLDFFGAWMMIVLALALLLLEYE